MQDVTSAHENAKNTIISNMHYSLFSSFMLDLPHYDDETLRYSLQILTLSFQYHFQFKCSVITIELLFQIDQMLHYYDVLSEIVMKI